MGITPFDNITFDVDIAFGSTPFDTSPAWTAVETYVRSIDINRGTSSEYTTRAPGTATITLDNRTRIFDPAYTSGTYYGDLNPMTPVRITSTYGGTTRTMFRGFVQGWPTDYDRANVDAVTTVECVDATRLLGNLSLPDDPFTDYMSNVAKNTVYFPFQQENETYVEPLTFASSFSPLPVNRGSIGNATTVEATTVNTFNVVPAFVEAWIVRTPGQPANLQIVAVGAENTGPSYRTLIDLDIRDDVIYVGIGTTTAKRLTSSTTFNLDNAEYVNHVVVTDDSGWKLFVNGVEKLNMSSSIVAPAFPGSKIGGNPFYINTNYSSFNGQFAHVAGGYGTGLTAAEVAEHYDRGVNGWSELSSARLTRTLDDAGWPALWRTIETGVQTVGAYRPDGTDANDYTDRIDNAEQGKLFVNRDGYVELLNRDTMNSANIVASFDDDNIDLPFTDITVEANTINAIINSVTSSYRFGTVTSQDATSITAYGRQNLPLDVQLVDDETDATAIGDAIVARAKNPRTLLKRLTVNVRSDSAALAPVMAGLDLGDDISVSFTPTGVGVPLWRAVTVQGLRHRIRRDSWETLLYLEPGAINTNGALLVLDDDTYGKLDSGNKLG